MKRGVANVLWQPQQNDIASRIGIGDGVKNANRANRSAPALVEPNKRGTFDSARAPGLRQKQQGSGSVIVHDCTHDQSQRLRLMEKMQVRSIVDLVSLAEQVRVGMQSADLRMPVG
jgi:hypothetical protein